MSNETKLRIAVLLVYGGIIAIMGFTGAGIFLVLAFVFGLIAYLAIGRWEKLHYYGRLLTDLYVYSETPDDRTLLLRADEHRHWLEKAGNQSGVQVHIIPYRDKDNPTESWEEYQTRKAEIIRQCETARHNFIEEAEGREFYLRQVHQQL